MIFWMYCDISAWQDHHAELLEKVKKFPNGMVQVSGLERVFRRWFRLPQRSHLRTLKNFAIEKSCKLCEKSGKYWIKSGDREILRRFIFSCIRAWYLCFLVNLYSKGHSAGLFSTRDLGDNIIQDSRKCHDSFKEP